MRLESGRHKEAKKKACPSSAKKAETESIATLLNPSHSKQQSRQLTDDNTSFIVDSNLPFSIAESPFLRRLIKTYYGQAKLPSGHDVCAEVPQKASRCIVSLQLFDKDQKISLTLDEVSVTGSYLSQEFVLCSKVLAVKTFLEKNTGDNIADKINYALAILNVNNSEAVAATRDGAPNIAGPKSGGCVKTYIKRFFMLTQSRGIIYPR